MSADDRQLLIATAEGDRSSFALFVRRHTASLLRFCLGRVADPHAAEDAVQEAMLRLFEQVANQRVPDDPAAWLFAIARRCCQEQHRQQLRHNSQRLDAQAESAAVDGARDESDLAALVDQLDDDEQALLHMKHTRGLRCREIADETGRPIGTITAKLSRIYAKLRAAMTSENVK